jgi:hypothetical protein
VQLGARGWAMLTGSLAGELKRLRLRGARCEVRGTRCLVRVERGARRVRAGCEGGRNRRVANKAQESSHSTRSTAQAEGRGEDSRLWAMGNGWHPCPSQPSPLCPPARARLSSVVSFTATNASLMEPPRLACPRRAPLQAITELSRWKSERRPTPSCPSSRYPK